MKRLRKIFPEVDMHNLEIFNLRNDKENLYNKIFYFDLVKTLIIKNKYKNIKIFSDNKSSKTFYESLINKNGSIKLDIIETSSNKKEKNIIYILVF